MEKYLERLAKFKTFFPRYRGVQLMDAVVAMVMPDSVASHAYHQGLYVLAQSGEMVKVGNNDAFEPKLW